MKPIAKPGDYILSVFDSTDNEIKQITWRRGLMELERLVTRYLRYTNDHLNKGYSARWSKVLGNTKYNVWSPNQ